MSAQRGDGKIMKQLAWLLMTPVLYFLAFPPWDLWALAWIALWGMIEFVSAVKNLSHAFWGGFVAGAAYQALNCWWMWRMLTFSQQPRWTFVVILGILQWAFAFMVLKRLQQSQSLPATLTVPTAWVASEFAYEFVASQFLGMMTNHFALGLSQACMPVISQVAAISGVPGVSWIVGSTNGFIQDVCCRMRTRPQQPRSSLGCIAGGVQLIAVLLYGAYSLNVRFDEGPRIVVIPRLFDAAEPSIQRFLESQGDAIELAIWPESSGGVIGPEAYSATRTALENAARSWQITLIVGATVIEERPIVGVRNAAVIVDPVQGIVGQYNKQFLVPSFELNLLEPSFDAALWSGDQFPILPGRGPGDLLELRKSRTFVGLGVCYDVAFSSWGRVALNRAPQPNLLVHCGNEPRDEYLTIQSFMLACSRFRAIESRRPIVRCVSGGFSAVIDSNGKLLHCSSPLQFDEAFVTGPIPLDQRSSLYSRWGDWPLLIGLTAVAFGSLRHRRFVIPH